MSSLLPDSAAIQRTVTNPWLARKVVIRSITPEIKQVATFELAFSDPIASQDYRFEPGQFNMLYLPGAGEAAISMSGDTRACQTLIHTIRFAGNVTRGISQLKPGETLGLRGPFGTSWPLAECIGREVVLVAGGIGLPPLRPVIYRLLAEPQKYGRIHLLFGARSPDALIYQREYDTWTHSGLDIQTTVDRPQSGWNGNVGVVTLLLERLQLLDPQNTVLMCCGPETMLRFVAKSACELGISAKQIWVSTERNMQCAIGLCGHCQLGPKFLCKDGPVLRYDHIEPYMKVEGL
jgi:NAD(P)H-flavin reductase